jgi:transcriptional regulator with XRE-family HTH domain
MARSGEMSIGERIKVLRQAKNLTQEELATRAGLTKGFISQVERNLTSLSVESLIGILDALDEKPSNFFDGAFEEKIVFKLKDRVDLEMEGVKGFRYSYRRRRIVFWTRRSSNSGPAKGPRRGNPTRVRVRFCSFRDVELVLGGKPQKVKKGECFYYRATRKHYIINKRKATAVLLWVSSPPNF